MKHKIFNSVISSGNGEMNHIFFILQLSAASIQHSAKAHAHTHTQTHIGSGWFHCVGFIRVYSSRKSFSFLPSTTHNICSVYFDEMMFLYHLFFFSSFHSSNRHRFHFVVFFCDCFVSFSFFFFSLNCKRADMLSISLLMASIYSLWTYFRFSFASLMSLYLLLMYKLLLKLFSVCLFNSFSFFSPFFFFIGIGSYLRMVIENKFSTINIT